MRSRQGVSALMSYPQSRMMLRVLARSSRQETNRSALPRNTFSATDSSGTTIECWKTVAIHSRQPADVARPGARARPRSGPCPASGATSPDRIDTIVDFPAPLRPTRPRHWPAAIERSTSCDGHRAAEPLVDAGHLTRAGPGEVMAHPFRAEVEAAGTQGDAGHHRLGGGADAAVRGPVDVAPQGRVGDRRGVTLPGRPSTGEETASVRAGPWSRTGATIGSARLVSPW